MWFYKNLENLEEILLELKPRDPMAWTDGSRN